MEVYGEDMVKGAFDSGNRAHVYIRGGHVIMPFVFFWWQAFVMLSLRGINVDRSKRKSLVLVNYSSSPPMAI